MKWYLSFYLIFSVCASLLAQEKDTVTKERDTVFERLEAELKKATVDTVKAGILFKMGVHHYGKNYALTKRYLSEVPEVLTGNDSVSNSLRGQAFQYLAAATTDQANYTEAMGYYMQSLNYFEATKDSLGIGNLYHNMAILHSFQGNLEEFKSNLLKSLRIDKDHKDKILEAYNYKNLGEYYGMVKKRDSALYFLDKAETIFIAQKFQNGINSVKAHKAKFYRSIGEYKKSIALFKECLDFGMKNEIPVFQIIYGNKLAWAYKDDGDFTNALKYNKLSLDRAIKDDFKQWIMNGYLQKSEIEQAIGNYKAAYESAKLHKQFSDSLFSKKNIRKIQELELNYEFRKEKLRDSLFLVREKELAETKLEKASARFWKILSIGAGIAAIIITIISIILQRKKAQVKVSKLKNDMLEKEVEYKKKDLKYFALDITQKREWALELLDKINVIKEATGKKRSVELDKLNTEIKDRIRVDENTELFYEKVESLGSSFYENLRDTYPKLTKTDMRLCTLIRMNLETKQIAILQNINPSSVKMSRNRLRKKLNLDSDVDLYQFLTKF
ncbi:MAG: transcriptional regulator [Bacteroidota bacterium]